VITIDASSTEHPAEDSRELAATTRKGRASQVGASNRRVLAFVEACDGCQTIEDFCGGTGAPGRLQAEKLEDQPVERFRDPGRETRGLERRILPATGQF
jgi:hypothetical protein